MNLALYLDPSLFFVLTRRPIGRCQAADTVTTFQQQHVAAAVDRRKGTKVAETTGGVISTTTTVWSSACRARTPYRCQHGNICCKGEDRVPRHARHVVRRARMHNFPVISSIIRLMGIIRPTFPNLCAASHLAVQGLYRPERVHMISQMRSHWLTYISGVICDGTQHSSPNSGTCRLQHMLWLRCVGWGFRPDGRVAQSPNTQLSGGDVMAYTSYIKYIRARYVRRGAYAWVVLYSKVRN